MRTHETGSRLVAACVTTAVVAAGILLGLFGPRSEPKPGPAPVASVK